MKILIVGGTGFIGSNLASFFIKHGYNVYVLTRQKKVKNAINNVVYINKLNYETNFNIIINLAGKSLNTLWFGFIKKAIFNSRIKSTNNIINYIQNSKIKPNLFISASAVGIYYLNNNLSEDYCNIDNTLNLNQNNFSNYLCTHWEKAAQQVLLLPNNTTKLVIIRLGVVLGNSGFLQLIKNSIKYQLGAIFSKGNQLISWIDIQDVCHATMFIIKNNLSGVYNFTSPNSISNKELTVQVGNKLNKKIQIYLPKWLIIMLFGQMGKELLISSINVKPTNLVKAGYKFCVDKISTSINNYC